MAVFLKEKSQRVWGWAPWDGGSGYLKGGPYAGWSTFGSRQKLTWKCVWILQCRRMGEKGLALLLREAQQKWWGNQGHGELSSSSLHFQQNGGYSWFSSQLIEGCLVAWPFYATVIWVITLHIPSPLSRGKIALSYGQFWGGERKWRDTIFSSKLTFLIKIVYQRECFNTTEIFC